MYVPPMRLAVPTVQVNVSQTAAEHPVAALPEFNERLEHVEVVAGVPPVKVAAAAVLK